MKEPMIRVQIIGLKDRLQPTVKALHELGCLHIEDMVATSAPAARPFAPDPLLTTQRETRARLLAQIEGQFAALVDESFKPDETPSAGHDCFDEAQAGAGLLAPQLQNLANQEEALASESATIPRYIATLRQLLPIIPEAAEKPGHIFTAVLVGRSYAWVLVELEQALLEKSAGRADLAHTVLTGDRHALVVVLPITDAHLLEQLLGRDDIARLQLPENIQHLSPQSALAVLQERERAMPAAQAQLRNARSALAPLWLPRLDAWRRCLRPRLDELEILNLFGETNDTFTVIGWLPQADLPRLSRRLQAQVGGGLYIEPLPLTAGALEQAPVLLRNPAPARPFQSLVKLLSLPSYDGLDPTILMAVGLPILFGIILGDIGYGALLLLFTLYGRRRFPAGTARDLMHVLMLGAGWSILFGFLYGEMFGTLGEHFGLHAIWFDRADPEALFALFIFSLAAGVTHITLGLLIGIWDAWRARHRHHLLERGGMFIGLIGLFMIVAVLADFLPAGAMNPGVAVLIIGIALLSSAMGWLGLLIGPIEFIGLIGNILSYLRLAAVGLASVYVARLANDLVGSIGSLVIGIIIAVLIHSLNLVLGAFSPTIHSLRLHYVEFFRKFYEGGGKPYAPFRIGD